MKLLLTSVFAFQHPAYLIPTAINTLFKYKHGLYEVFPTIGTVKEALFREGLYEGIELDLLSSGVINRSTMTIDVRRLDLFKKQHIPVESVHAIYPLIQMDVSPTEYLNLAVFHEKITRGLKAHIELTSQLVKTFPLLVVHPGIIPNAVPLNTGIWNVISNITSVLKQLEKTNVTLCLENVAPIRRYGVQAVGDDWQTLQKIVRAINHPQVKVVYDMGHANLSARHHYEMNQKVLHTDYLSEFEYHYKFIRELRDDIVFAHLSYNPAHLLDKKVSRRERISGYDFHQGLNKADKCSLMEVKKVIRYLMGNTNIQSYGDKILVEMSPSSLVKYAGFGYMGGSDSDAVQTAHILKNQGTHALV